MKSWPKVRNKKFAMQILSNLGFRISNCQRWEYYVYKVDMCSQIQIFLKKWEYLSLEGWFFGDCPTLLLSVSNIWVRNVFAQSQKYFRTYDK